MDVAKALTQLIPASVLFLTKKASVALAYGAVVLDDVLHSPGGRLTRYLLPRS